MLFHKVASRPMLSTLMMAGEVNTDDDQSMSESNRNVFSGYGPLTTDNGKTLDKMS
jgi:hypothetical protein